jgi:rare lipoprotein A
VLVENLENGRSLRVRINDRGPYAKGRILHLSRAAADELGIIGDGEAQVRIRPLDVSSNAEEARKRAG